MYIVIFNSKHSNPVFLTDHNDFLKEFTTVEQAEEAAESWMNDNYSLRSFTVYAENE